MIIIYILENRWGNFIGKIIVFLRVFLVMCSLVILFYFIFGCLIIMVFIIKKVKEKEKYNKSVYNLIMLILVNF